MRTVFADTVFWIAIFRPGDPWRAAALAARQALTAARIVTTDEVLAEFLSAFSRAGEHARIQAARFVRRLLSHPTVEVRAQSRGSFLEALALYEERGDKSYSLTDCRSMSLMRAEGLSEVLTSDRHFVQEGFTILLTEPHRRFAPVV